LEYLVTDNMCSNLASSFTSFAPLAPTTTATIEALSSAIYKSRGHVGQ
jgi:hypothetical protein